MSKKRKNEPAPTPIPEMGIPQELANQINALKGFVQCHDLLAQASLPHSAAPAVGQCLQFLRALHSHALTEALKHPSAALAPELRQAREMINGQA